MKKFIIPAICILLTTLSIIFINPITDKTAKLITDNPKLVIKPGNNYTKSSDYLYVQRTTDFVPYSIQDILNIYYTVTNNGWSQFTFYCPREYTECINDISKISGKNESILTHLNNYVHPFNSFTNIKTTIYDSGEITLKIYYLYTPEEIDAIDKKTDEIIKEVINDEMDDYDKIKTIHDYVVNHTKYDEKQGKNEYSPYNSYKAYGPLLEGYATCNGYTDLMAIFLSKLGFDNYRIATTPEDISNSDTGHIWNGVFYNNAWYHIDLTWDDPIDKNHPNKDYLFHTYFLVNNEAMAKADGGETIIEDHKFNSLYYLEYN